MNILHKSRFRNLFAIIVFAIAIQGNFALANKPQTLGPCPPPPESGCVACVTRYDTQTGKPAEIGCVCAYDPNWYPAQQCMQDAHCAEVDCEREMIINDPPFDPPHYKWKCHCLTPPNTKDVKDSRSY